jgi:hypothetical protein
VEIDQRGRAVFVLRYQALQAHQAGVPEQVRADLALSQVTQEDAIDAARQEPAVTPSGHF